MARAALGTPPGPAPKEQPLRCAVNVRPPYRRTWRNGRSKGRTCHASPSISPRHIAACAKDYAPATPSSQKTSPTPAATSTTRETSRQPRLDSPSFAPCLTSSATQPPAARPSPASTTSSRRGLRCLVTAIEELACAAHSHWTQRANLSRVRRRLGAVAGYVALLGRLERAGQLPRATAADGPPYADALPTRRGTRNPDLERDERMLGPGDVPRSARGLPCSAPSAARVRGRYRAARRPRLETSGLAHRV